MAGVGRPGGRRCERRKQTPQNSETFVPGAHLAARRAKRGTRARVDVPSELRYSPCPRCSVVTPDPFSPSPPRGSLHDDRALEARVRVVQVIVVTRSVPAFAKSCVTFVWPAAMVPRPALHRRAAAVLRMRIRRHLVRPVVVVDERDGLADRDRHVGGLTPAPRDRDRRAVGAAGAAVPDDDGDAAAGERWRAAAARGRADAEGRERKRRSARAGVVMRSEELSVKC